MYNNPLHPFLVQVKRGTHFVVENWSCSTKESALDLALSFCQEYPEWICVVKREGSVIYSTEEIEAEHRRFCDEVGFKSVVFDFDLL